MNISHAINVFANIGCPEFRESSKYLCDTKTSAPDISPNLLIYKSEDILEGRPTSATSSSFDTYSGRSESTASVTSEPKGKYLVLNGKIPDLYFHKY